MLSERMRGEICGSVSPDGSYYEDKIETWAGEVAALEARVQRLTKVLSAIVGYTRKETDQTELWVHRTAKKGLEDA